jgi:hypothetical protein
VLLKVKQLFYLPRNLQVIMKAIPVNRLLVTSRAIPRMDMAAPEETVNRRQSLINRTLLFD